jgi:hypothetical protein
MCGLHLGNYLDGVQMNTGELRDDGLRPNMITYCDGRRQLGLGSNVTLNTITVPTEIVFSNTVSGRTGSRCLGVCAGIISRLTPDVLNYPCT